MMRRPGGLHASPDSHSLIGTSPLGQIWNHLELGYTGSEKGPGWSRLGKETKVLHILPDDPKLFHLLAKF